MAKRRIIYRDSKTGRFVKKSTWARSRAQGGKRYKSSRVTARRKPTVKAAVKRVARKPIAPSRPATGPIFEWIVNFTYKKSGRSFDVITTARSEQEAFDVAKQFLRDDPQGQRIVRAGFHGWLVDPPARGERTNEEVGNAEYRSKSKGKRK